MVKVNVQDAKTHLSRYLDAVEKGEVVILCRHNKPIAEMRALPKESQEVDLGQGRKAPRFGLWDGFGVSESFFEPLDHEISKAFHGE
jgi:antitoxin (DNA-binding transcriptional repressor) of toxin-antitoxin stability system